MSKRKICVVTGSRAEYGLLYWVIKGLCDHPEFQLQLVVTGMHLSPEFGLTYQEIENDGFSITKKVDILLSSDTHVGISKSIGLGVIGFADVFADLDPDLLMVLGDRFEILAAATAATIAKIPIAHCHGGETTQGAFDESIRHSLTKMSHLHFAAVEEYRKRIIQLGENPERVYHVGGLGIENIRRMELMSREAFEKSISFSLGNQNFLVSFHTVTLETSTAADQFGALLEALGDFPDARIIFTKANADTDGRIINKMIDDYVAKNNSSVAFPSLGQLRYLSALQLVDVVIGNSSSGLIEVPSFKKPTVNIGDRQKGRIKASTVIDCLPDKESISKAITKALSSEFASTIRDSENPYDAGNASEKIIKVLESVSFKELLKKSFHDLPQ